MKYIFALLALWLAAPANSQYINQIIDEEKEGVFYSTPKLTDTHLFYQTQRSAYISLWSMDLITKKKEKLIDSLYDTEDDEDTEDIDFIKPYRGKTYFSHVNEQFKRNLWSTDGSKTGTQLVNNTKLNSGGKFGVFNDELFAENIDQYLIQLNNGVFELHNIKYPSLDHICVFSEDDFIVQSRNAAADTFTLNRVKGSTITAVYTYASTYDDDAGFVVYNDSCLFTHTAADVRKVMSVPKNGEPKFISVPDSVSSFEQLINHQGQIYFSAQNDDSTSYSVHRLNKDLSAVDATINISGIFSIVSISSDNHLLTAVIEFIGSGGLSAHVFFDQELNEVHSNFQFYYNLNKSIYASFSDVITVYNDPVEDAVIQSIDDQNNVTLLSIKGHGIGEVVSQSGSDEIYLVLFDRNIGKANIYSLNEQPPLNNSINGTWHEPDIASQGLVIQKGQRHDGSDYVFATFYVFDQGQPLWLAGVGELKLDQKTINIDLFKYNGIQLFEFDTAPNQELFGQISLELENCNTLNLTISSEVYNLSLPLYRIDDISFNYLCPEVKPLNPDNYNSNALLKEQINE